MIRSCGAHVLPILTGLFVIFGLSGCSTPHFRSASGSDHSYIVYWPPPKDSKGLRLAVKDLIDVRGVVTTAGSEYFARNNPPARRDAACLAIARERGVQIVGKTNLSEFTLAPSGENAYFGTPRNPITKWRRRIPGGSSSGSAVAVASGTCDVAFGTDTAGSVRLPAACCGIVGLKTTFGLISLKGVYPVEPEHLDTVGPMGKDIAHTVEGMDLLQKGFALRYRAAVATKPSGKGIKIGRLYLSGTAPKIDAAVDAALAKAGFQIVPLDEPFRAAWDQAAKDANTMAAAWAWISDRKFTSNLEVSARTKDIVLLGQFEYEVNYQKALARRAAWQAALAGVLKRVDYVALPTMQELPPKAPLWGGTVLFEARVLGIQNTSPVNLAGNPALAIPVPVKDRSVPVTSLQLVGPRLSEARLLNAGRLVEAALSPQDQHSTAVKAARVK
jgi:amidase